MADYTLSAKITADIKGFVSNINTVTKKAESMAEKLSTNGNRSSQKFHSANSF